MKSKIIQSIPAALALAIIGFRYFSQWCILENPSCYGTWVHNIYNYVTYPFYSFSLFFLPIALILIFVPRAVFISWLKLAAWAIPLSIIFIFTTDVSSTRMGIDFFPFYRDDAARFAGQVFAAISLILIIWKWIAARRHGSI